MAMPRRLPARSRLSLRLGALSAGGLAIVAPVVALAASQLLVNGVPIGKVELRVQGLEGVTFEKCNNVKVESNGDVKIDCPGYDLKAAAGAAQPEPEPAKAAAPPASALGKISKHYWLVTSQTQPGATQFDVDLYVNGKWVKRFKNSDSAAVIEISKHLVAGDNKIIFAATKAAEPRKATSAEAVYKFIIGEGDIVGANLRLDKVDITYQKTAADVENSTDEKSLTAG